MIDQPAPSAFGVDRILSFAIPSTLTRHMARLRRSLHLQPKLATGAQVDASVSDLAMDDWDLLFRAVLGRLAATVEAPVTATTIASRTAAAESVRSILLECAQALDQLHASAAQDLERQSPAGSSASTSNS